MRPTMARLFSHRSPHAPPLSTASDCLRFQSTYATELGSRTTPLTWWPAPTSGVTASFTARPPRREIVNSRWRVISLLVRGPLIAIQSRGRSTSRRTVSVVNSGASSRAGIPSLLCDNSSAFFRPSDHSQPAGFIQLPSFYRWETSSYLTRRNLQRNSPRLQVSFRYRSNEESQIPRPCPVFFYRYICRKAKYHWFQLNAATSHRRPRGRFECRYLSSISSSLARSSPGTSRGDATEPRHATYPWLYSWKNRDSLIAILRFCDDYT